MGKEAQDKDNSDRPTDSDRQIGRQTLRQRDRQKDLLGKVNFSVFWTKP